MSKSYFSKMVLQKKGLVLELQNELENLNVKKFCFSK